MNQQKLRFGIIGCAGIAIRSGIPGIIQSQLGEITAIASRDYMKAKKTAEKLGIPVAYGSYEELLADPTIDAVYIPLPNHLHMEWTIKAAEAGKHVLCEKPIALTTEDTKKMVEACDKAGVQLAEAFMYRHHPRYDMIKSVIDAGKIGEIRGIHGTFTFNSSAGPGNVRFQRSMGGGSIYDIGCYPISAARLILGSEPVAATVHAFFSPEHDHVDMMASGLLEFPDSVSLTFDCGMWAASRNTLEILGTKGRIEVPSAFVSELDRRANFLITIDNEQREVDVPQVNQYAAQVDDFVRSIVGESTPKFGPKDAILNMRVIDACLESANEQRRVTI